MADTPQKKTRVKRKQSTKIQQPIDRSTISAIARGMQYAVNSTQEIMESHYKRMFDRYFSKDGKPDFRTFKISDEQSVQAPLIALIPLNSLVLDEVVVEMSVIVIEATSKNLGHQDNDPNLDRTSFGVSFSAGNKSAGTTNEEGNHHDNTINIKMTFKRGDPPEGVSRVLDEFYKAVVVSRTEKEKK